jgi:spermidine/putrescine-binding protein
MDAFGSRFGRPLTLALLVTLFSAACAPAATPTPTGPKVAPSGFQCPEPSPRIEVTSQQLNLFVWTEYIPQDIVDCFELVYDIEINREEYSSNEEMYAKVEAGGTVYDLAQPSDYIIGVMIRNSALQKMDQSRLPNLKNIGPGFLKVPGDPTGEYVVPYQAGTQAIVYDSATVTTPPTSWTDLWKPEYAGRMVFVDDMRSVIAIALLVEGKDPNTTAAADLEAVKPRLQELVNNIKIFDSDSPKTHLIAGDADLGYVWNAEAELAAREKPSLRYAFPQEGAILWQDGWVMLKDAPHPDAAYAWMNYVLQGDVFWLMLRDFPYTMPNTAALEYARANTFEILDADGNTTTPQALYELYINSNITNPPPEVWAAGHFTNDVGEATPLYDRLWTEVKGGQ